MTSPTTTDLLKAYDDRLRTRAEMLDALDVTRIGPLWLGTFRGGRGFITYRELEGAPPEFLVERALDHFERHTSVTDVEWKTRSHDQAPGLHEVLVEHGFVPGEPESVMLGRADSLATDSTLPSGVSLRRITAADDIVRMMTMQDEVFGSSTPPERLLHRMVADPHIECWVAESGGEIVSAGRLHPVQGTEFAGIWGGATLPRWRRRGIYRALTAARARSALSDGKTYIHSDSTEYSRPILERHGFVRVTGTTPYVRVLRSSPPS